jgi:hypothetical protein
MRLVKTNGDRRQMVVGPGALEQLRDVGARLDYIVARYGRLVTEVSDGRPLPDLQDSVELMNNQIGYVARRLQDLLVASYEQRHAGADEDEPLVFGREMVAASN